MCVCVRAHTQLFVKNKIHYVKDKSVNGNAFVIYETRSNEIDEKTSRTERTVGDSLLSPQIPPQRVPQNDRNLRAVWR